MAEQGLTIRIRLTPYKLLIQQFELVQQLQDQCLYQHDEALLQ